MGAMFGRPAPRDGGKIPRNPPVDVGDPPVDGGPPCVVKIHPETPHYWDFALEVPSGDLV